MRVLSLNELDGDFIRNQLLFVRFLKNAGDGFASIGAVIESEFIDVHTDEAVDLRRIQSPGKLRRVFHSFFTMIKTILNAFLDVDADLGNQFRTEIAPDHVAA